VSDSGFPAGWHPVTVERATRKVPIGDRKLKRRQYLSAGRFPVVDQGQELIGGYSEEDDLVIDCGHPLIVFGDHSRTLKYVRFPFIAGADGIVVLDPVEAFDSRCLFYLLEAVEFPDRGYSRHYQFLRKATVPLPPLNEQRRIVAKIEALFSELDAGVAALQRSRALLARYRQSLLQAAFSGELTADWRAAHQGPIEPAEALLERILMEREGNWLAAEKAKLFSLGRTEPLEKTRKRYRQPATLPADPLADLPSGWAWSTLDLLVHNTIDYRGKTPPTADEGIPIISAANVRNGRIVTDQPRFVSQETYRSWLTRGTPRPGDLVVTTEAPVGNVALYPEDETYLLTRRVMALQMTGANPSYLLHCFGSQVVRDYIDANSRGTTVPRILKPILLAMPLPVAPEAEQAEIVARVDHALGTISRVEHEIDTSLARATRLRQAILKRAFQGRLVPQDPTDQPAAALLAKIRNAR